MLRKHGIIFCWLIFLSFSVFSQSEEGLVKWLDFKTAQEKNKIQAKPILIDFYTDWCGWCKHMIKTTYSNPALASYINTNFYPVKFNAETKDTIEYNGKTYKPLSKEPRTPHELTLKFLGNSLSYPSTVFVTNNYEYNLLTQGYLDEKKIEPILVFMVENAWRNAIFDEFNTHFTHTFVDTNFKKIAQQEVKIQQLEKTVKKNKKKTLLVIGADFCNTCKVMNKTTFADTSVGKYVQKNYNLVYFNAESNDTITYKDQKYFKQLVNGYPLNTLAFQFTGNRFTIPALCILDEDLKPVEILNYYQSPQQIKPVLQYFGSDSYKKKTWKEYIAEYTTNTAPKKK